MRHDQSYKLIFSNAEMIRDLFIGFVDEPWGAEVDFATLEREPDSYVTDDLRDREDDIIWRVNVRGQPVYVYILLECQSGVDPFMAVRSMGYLALLYQDVIANGWWYTAPLFDGHRIATFMTDADLLSANPAQYWCAPGLRNICGSVPATTAWSSAGRTRFSGNGGMHRWPVKYRSGLIRRCLPPGLQRRQSCGCGSKQNRWRRHHRRASMPLHWRRGLQA